MPKFFYRAAGAAMLPLALILTPAFPSSPSGAPPDEEIVIGKRTSLYSDILGEWRPLEIYTPQSYDDSSRRYPVLVVLDGGRFFRYCVSIIDMISPNHLPEMIVVGIPNVNRSRDLDPAYEGSGGRGDEVRSFRRFLEEELFPFLASDYRALPYRVLAGHSLAGFSATHCAFADPDLFRAYIATSPAISGGPRKTALYDAIDAADPAGTNGRFLFCSMGGDEGEARVAELDTLFASIEAKKELGLQSSRDLYFGEGHVPVKGFYRGIRLLFDDFFPRDPFIDADLPGVIAHYEALSARYGFPVRPPFEILNAMANRRLNRGETAAAVEIHRHLVSVYPESAWGHANLGRALSRSGDTASACRAFKEALRLAPGDGEILSMSVEAGCPRGND